jgi:hypothetical protein
MHNQRISVRNIEAGLDDRGGEENVVVAVIEGGHHVLKCARRQLPMRGGHLQLGDVLGQKLAHLIEVRNARYDIEGLPTTIALAPQRFTQDNRIEG